MHAEGVVCLLTIAGSRCPDFGACASERETADWFASVDSRCCEPGGTVQDDHTTARQANRRPEVASENQKTQAR